LDVASYLVRQPLRGNSDVSLGVAADLTFATSHIASRIYRTYNPSSDTSPVTKTLIPAVAMRGRS